MSAAKPSRVMPPARFGIFEFDTRSGELRRHGVRIRLCHQASQLLSFLLKAPGKIRTREELRQQLWPATTFVNFDHSINKAVYELREALGDWATSPRFIETVVGQGYRFLPVLQHPRLISKSAAARKIKSVAVLPFATEGSAAGAAFVGGQIASRVTDGLAKISGLRVLAYSTVKHVTSQQANPQRIGKQLDVRGVIFGELVWQNSDLLVHVELIDVADGSQLWGAQLQQACESLIECAENLSEQILQQLEPVLDPRRAALRAQSVTSQPARGVLATPRVARRARSSPPRRA